MNMFEEKKFSIFDKMEEFFVVTHIEYNTNTRIEHKTDFLFSAEEAEDIANLYLIIYGDRGHVYIYHIKDGQVLSKTHPQHS
ncbi:MAG: hypothetical protein E7510_10450 [Ruminococcus sp.]|nr:hypothetical protein [Ruminococcus sp.]